MPRPYGLITLSCMVPVLAHASGFGSPVPIAHSSYPVYLEPALAVDGAGDITLAALIPSISRKEVNTSSIATVSRPAGGRWGKLASIYRYQGYSSISKPVIRNSSAGIATAVWEEAAPGGETSVIYAADRPPGGAWTVQEALTFQSDSYNVPFVFVEDEAGDAAIVLMVPTTNSQPTAAINAIRRPAGSTVWGPLENVTVIAAGTGAEALDAAIDPLGDVSVAWEGYKLICPHRCHERDFTLHVTQAAAGSSVWQDSGALHGLPEKTYFQGAKLTTDTKGHAALAYTLATGPLAPGIAVSHQRTWAGPWGMPAGVVTSSDGLALLGFVTGPDGASDLLYADYQTGQNITINQVSGSIADNRWAPAATLVPAFLVQDYGPQFLLGSSQSGHGLLSWVMNDGTLQAITTKSPKDAWGSPMVIVEGSGSTTQCAADTCTVLGGVAVNDAGRAAISYVVASPTKPNMVVYAVHN
jgi:hypothetical protein